MSEALHALTPRQERAFAALAGALIADAAALGFHWLYDPQRLAERGGSTPEFHRPDPADFAGVPGYFAHSGKAAGDLSQYGAGMQAATRALVAGRGSYGVRAHQAAFQATFGAGGSWSGYVDHPTQATLANLLQGAASAKAAGLSLAAELALPKAEGWVAQVVAAARTQSGQALLQGLAAAGELSQGACAVAEAVDAAWLETSGDQDQQLPALSALVPLVAAGASDAEVEAATRVTHHDNEAVAWALTCAAALRVALAGGTPAEAAAAAQQAASEDLAPRLAEGLALSMSSRDAIGALGRNCTLSNAVPGLLHVATHATSYELGVRENVFAGGDSCGRALVLGAILGAAFGVGGERGIPYLWLTRLAGAQAELGLASSLARLSN